MFASFGILLAELAKVGEIACANMLAGEFGFDELMVVKFTCVSLLAWVMLRAKGLTVLSSHWKMQILRVLVGLFSTTLATFASMHLPVALAVSCRHLSSIYIALIVTVLLIIGKKPFSRARLGCVVLGFIGICFLSDWNDLTSIDRLGLAAGIVGALFTAASALVLKKLGELGEPLARTVFYFTFSAALWSWGLMVCERGLAGIRWTIFTDPVMLMTVGFVAVTQFGRAFGWAKGEAILNAVLQYAGLPFGIVVGYVILGQTFDWRVTAGMGLILLAALGATLLKTKTVSGR